MGDGFLVFWFFFLPLEAKIQNEELILFFAKNFAWCLGCV
jgi:hypothetical protein